MIHITTMRIAMVGPFGFHPNKTMHSRALGLARPLAAAGHPVQLIMPPWHTPAEAGQIWQEDGVSICYVSLAGGLPGAVGRMLRAVAAWRPDVVHCFKPKAHSGLVAWWLWQFSRGRQRLVTDMDDWEGAGGWNERAAYSRLQRWFFARQEAWGLRHQHALTVASRALETIAWSHGLPPAQVTYLPNGAGVSDPWSSEAERLAARARQRAELGLEERPTLLLYSRLFEFEPQRLAAVLSQVQAAVPGLAILAVGTGLTEADSARWRAALAAAGLLGRVTDVGWVEAGALPPLLAAADAGIYLMEDTLLNRAKCPVKLADMVALGVPVVAEDVGQVGEYVRPDQTGRLRPVGDIDGLAADLTRLLQQPGERARLAAGARAHYRAHLAWDRLAQRLLAAYGG